MHLILGLRTQPFEAAYGTCFISTATLRQPGRPAPAIGRPTGDHAGSHQPDLDVVGFSLNKELTDLTPFLYEIVEFAPDLFQGREVCLETAIEDGLPVIEIDRTRIRQVLFNLLNNARRFTESGQVQVEALCQGDQVLFAVSDTGRGIPPEKLPHIFDEFYQVDPSLRRQHGGAGLGLAISKRFVEAHEGHIWVESALEAGTVFYFSLPVGENPSGLAGELSTPQPAWRTGSPVVLVLHPDQGVVALLRRRLEAFEVIQLPAAAELPAAIGLHRPLAVIDGLTPPGESLDLVHHAGERLAKERPAEVRGARDERLVTITCTLWNVSLAAGDLGISAPLTKPVTPAELLAELSAYPQARRILVVDVERGFCQLVESVLAAGRRDYILRKAYDPVEAAAILQTWLPDLLLLDKGCLEVLETLHRSPALARLPVLLLSAEHNPLPANPAARRFVLERAGGLSDMEVFGCLQGVLRELEE